MWVIQCKWTQEALKDYSRQLVPNIPEWHNATWNYQVAQGGYPTMEEAIKKMCTTPWSPHVHVRVFHLDTGEVVPGDLFDLHRVKQLNPWS